jgi:hypothetical protein
VESDAFDGLFESALTNQDPVIVIQTHTGKPDWGDRLNAWIAAWNLGGKVQSVDEGRKVRGQAPLSSVVVNAESIREFRLLIDDLMTRVEELALLRSAWWKEERVKSSRVALLKPYNLRFHMDDDGDIQLIFFNGRYSDYYRDYIQAIATPDADNPEEWARGVTCSRCKRSHVEAPPKGGSTTRSASP